MRFDEIEAAVKALADPEDGWVNRRDAADALGDVARRALDALNAHQADPDVDVRAAVQRALGRATAGLAGLKPRTEPPHPAPDAPPAPKTAYLLDELAQACDRPGRRTVSPCEDGYQVEVVLKNERRQLVYVTPAEGEGGVKLVRVFTSCGKPTPESLRWALRTNMKVAHGALALSGEGDEEHFVLINYYLADEATPAEVRASVKELAVYGDWIEQRLAGADER